MSARACKQFTQVIVGCVLGSRPMPHSQHLPSNTSSLGMSISAMAHGCRSDGVLLLLLHTGYLVSLALILVAFVAAVVCALHGCVAEALRLMFDNFAPQKTRRHCSSMK